MLLPSVVASTTIQSEMTRFIVAAVSVTQLIYMSEVGGVLLGSKIPINIKELIIIFIERTLITLPVIVLIANLYIKYLSCLTYSFFYKKRSKQKLFNSKILDNGDL